MGLSKELQNKRDEFITRIQKQTKQFFEENEHYFDNFDLAQFVMESYFRTTWKSLAMIFGQQIFDYGEFRIISKEEIQIQINPRG